MNKDIYNQYFINDSIFQDDNAILNLMYILETGHTRFLMFLYDEKYTLYTTICRLENGKYQLNIEIPKSIYNQEIGIEVFFRKPAILVIPSLNNTEQPNLNIIISQNDIESVSLTLSNEDSREATIIIKAFRADYDDNKWNNSKQAALFRFNPLEFDPHHKGIIYNITTSTDQRSGFSNATKIEIGGITYLFYYEIISKEIGFFIVKSPDRVSHKDLEEVVDSIRSAYALITGYYIAESVFYFSCKPKNRESLTFKYQSLNSTINSQKPILDFRHYSNVNDDKILLSSVHFEKLVHLLYKNIELRRACVLIAQAGILDNVSKGIMASVALETVASYFLSKETTKVGKIIEDKDIASQLRYELQKAIKKIKNRVDKTIWEKLSNRIGKINELPNATKLSTPFATLGITLSEQEEYCLNCRNLFLHGAIPKPKEDIYKHLSQEELQSLIANRLCMLSAMLILKKAGYNGNVVDWGATEIVYKREIAAGHGSKHLSFQHRDISN